jgi:hypothetical protein
MSSAKNATSESVGGFDVLASDSILEADHAISDNRVHGNPALIIVLRRGNGNAGRPVSLQIFLGAARKE